MAEFIVEITTTIPEGTPQAEVDRRRTAESARAAELAASGHLVRIWRPIGEMRSIGLWSPTTRRPCERTSWRPCRCPRG